MKPVFKNRYIEINTMELIIEANEQHLDDFVKMGLDLWPEEPVDDLKKLFLGLIHSDKNKVLLYSIDEKIVAFIYLSVRNDYVEGSESCPAGYVEGIYVTLSLEIRGLRKNC